MARPILTAVAVLVLGLVSATPADAQAGFIRWLERLSGPGPFVGYGYEQLLPCLGHKKDGVGALDTAASKGLEWDGSLNCQNTARDKTRLIFSAEGDWLRGASVLDYPERTDVIDAWIAMGAVDIGLARAVEAGVGVGEIVFTGAPETVQHLIIEPRITFKLRAAKPTDPNNADAVRAAYRREALQLRLAVAVLPGTISVADFGATGGDLQAGTHYQFSVQIRYNFANATKH